MSVWDEPIVRRAEAIAESILFPAAISTDLADLVPVSHLDELASSGFYGLLGPPEAGGIGAGLDTLCAVVEHLASGCLATTFVWIQHHSVVRAIAGASPALRSEWLRALCAGERRAGIALGGLRPSSGGLVAEPTSEGWSFSGSVPWVTGWGRIDVILTAAGTTDGRVVRALVDARSTAGLEVRPLRLVAANASGTVELSFANYQVPGERVLSVEPYAAPPPHDGGGRPNGSLALGIARRCCMLVGSSVLDTELESRRARLDAATEETMAEARAAAAELASWAATALIVHSGSRSLLVQEHAQRLAREAMFTLVFGTRPAIRAGLLRRLGLNP